MARRRLRAKWRGSAPRKTHGADELAGETHPVIVVDEESRVVCDRCEHPATEVDVAEVQAVEDWLGGRTQDAVDLFRLKFVTHARVAREIDPAALRFDDQGPISTRQHDPVSFQPEL